MRRFLFSVVAVLAAGLVIMACGGGGSSEPANTMSVTADGGTIIYKEGAINNLGYYDPDLAAGVLDSGRTEIMLTSGVRVVGGIPQPDITINIVTSDHIAKAYPIDGDSGTAGTTYVFYKAYDELHESIVSSGTVTLDSIGNPGGRIIGSFSGVVLCTSSTHTHSISGTFDVKREN